MDWIKSDLSEFLCPPKKKQKLERSGPSAKFGSTQIRSNLSTQNEISTKLNLLGKYCPKNKDELVVNKKKIEEVENWLKNLVNESTYLLLTGPPGCGKLRTLSVICQILKIDLVEWTSPINHNYDPDSYNPFYQNELQAFEEFIMRASRYTNVISQSTSRLIIVKDIPNGFIRNSSLFHTLLENYYGIEKMRIVFIISEFTVCRDLFPENIKISFNVKTINFNPITERNISTALQNVVKKLDLLKINSNVVSYIEEISSDCNGDLRNAFATLQFLLVKGKFETVKLPALKKRKTKGAKLNKKTDSDLKNSNTISDNKIDIFHGLGRVLYAKKENGRLVHDPQDIANSFTSCPQLFISMLHENYLSTFSSIHDISKASVNLVVSDILQYNLDFNSSYIDSGLSVASHGLMSSNSNPIKKFQQFNKGRTQKVNMVREYKDLLESSYPSWKGLDIVMDIAPFIKKISSHDLPHKDIIVKLGTLY